MTSNVINKIFEKLLISYFELDEIEIDLKIKDNNIVPKERVGTINDLQVLIYSNDHNPPHFHVKSKNFRIDAKFLIENGELISGKISRKDLKRVKAFYLSPKTKILMDNIWNKKQI